MIIKREQQGNVVFLKIFGEINRVEAGDLRKELEKLLEEKKYNVVLDLEEIKFISSHTIMTLLRMNREFLAMGGGLKLYRPRNVVKRFLSIGRVLELFERFETRVDAMRSFQKEIKTDSIQDEPSYKLRDAGRDQRAALLRLLEILQSKNKIDIDEFYNEMNKSPQLVFSVFRNNLKSNHDHTKS